MTEVWARLHNAALEACDRIWRQGPDDALVARLESCLRESAAALVALESAQGRERAGEGGAA